MMYYYIKFLSGSNAGEKVELKNGEHILGRSDGCDIVLKVAGISKRHAKITIADRSVFIEDLGSSNGTYVNGVFVTRKTLAVGDKIVLPGIVFSLNVGVSEEQNNLSATGTTNAFRIVSTANQDAPIDVAPSSMKHLSAKEQAQGWFLKNIQPIFDRILMKYEWKFVVFCMLALFGTLVTVISGIRFTAVNHSALKSEVKRRGIVLAERMAEINTPFIRQNNEALLDVEKTRRQEGVRTAYITSVDGHILAPGSDRGSYVPSSEWLSAVRSNGGGVVPVVVDGSITSMIFSHPIPRFDSKKGINVSAAMAVVEVSVSAAELHWSQSFNIILTTLVLVLILVFLTYSIIYRMTAQPFQDMNDEIDQVLKGNRSELRVPVKFIELETLTRSFNFLLNKVKSERAAAANNAISSDGGGAVPHPLMGDINDDPSFKFVVENAPGPVLVLDSVQKVVLISAEARESLLIRGDDPHLSIVDACEDQTVLGNILEAEKEARALNGIPFQANFDAFGREYHMSVVAAFDELGEHLRTVYIFVEIKK